MFVQEHAEASAAAAASFKSASDDACFGAGRDKLSGWLILDPHFCAVCIRLSKTCIVQIETLRFYLPPKSPRKKPSKWDRASSEAGSLLATRTATPKDSMSGARQFINLWLRTLTSLGSVRAALNRLEKHLCQRVSGRDAGIGHFRRKDHSTRRIDSHRNRGAGAAFALLPNRCTTVNKVEFHHSPHGIVLAAQLAQSLFLSSSIRTGVMGGSAGRIVLTRSTWYRGSAPSTRETIG
jgi:hypothetical protein